MLVIQCGGGRFSEGPAAIMEEINASIGYDQRMAAQDIRGSIAHATMLQQVGILSQDDVDAIIEGLNKILVQIQSGEFQFSRALEDIHMNIEAKLKDMIGDAAGRLHTARSRNDQVATDFKLYVRDTIDRIDEMLRKFQLSLAQKAENHAETVMPGFTHLQSAQPVTFGHHMLAYVEMIARDRGRLQDARKRMNECPLGSAALAGTSFPINRDLTAELLGFDRPTANSLDAVSDRDFVLETLSALSIMAVHLSRMAEEIVIWSSVQFSFIKLSDQFTTGSSIMPQKRNPDAAELVRAKTGRILGSLNTLMVVMKGLPLAYSKDMQEDKEPFFDALDSIELCIMASHGMVEDMIPNEDVLKQAAGSGYATATDLADWLVRVLNMPFRNAHHVTGTLVGMASKAGIELHELTLEQMQSVEPQINVSVYDVLSVDASTRSRVSYGGTAPENVIRAAKQWIQRLV